MNDDYIDNKIIDKYNYCHMNNTKSVPFLPLDALTNLKLGKSVYCNNFIIIIIIDNYNKLYNYLIKIQSV